MEISWLLDFLALADTRSFSKAAKQRHSSQSAFSRRIQLLEQWLGMRLVDRATIPVELTAEGETFAATATHIVTLAEGARVPAAERAKKRHA